MLLPFGDWTPDQPPAYAKPGALAVARTAIPLPDGTDGPIRAPVAITTAVGSLDQIGAYSLPDPLDGFLGEPTWFVGRTRSLHRHQAGAWTDVTRAAGSYSSTGVWRFAQFGGRVIATNSDDPVQSHDIAAGTAFADLAAAAPRAKFVATVEPGFLMLGNLSDGGGADTPNAVHWSGLNDATGWPTIGTAAAASAQSDRHEFPEGMAVTGIAPGIGGAAAAVFTKRGIYRMDYAGPPAIFSVQQVDRSRGCAAPGSLVQLGGVAFFWSEEGFLAFDGVQVRAIGAGRVDRFFRDDFRGTDPRDIANVDAIVAAADPRRKIVVWGYPSRGGGGAAPDRWLIYSYATDRWRWSDDASISCRLLFPLDLYNYGTIGGFRGGNTVVLWDVPTQPALQAEWVTGRTDAGAGSGRRVFVSGLRLHGDMGLQGAAGLATADTPGGAAADQTLATPNAATGIVPQRLSGRYVAGRALVSASASWTYANGLELLMRTEGRR